MSKTVNTIRQEYPLYREPLRPRFHFTARYWNDYRLNPGQCQEGWLNDVNGLMQLDGEYHLFAQRWWSCWLHAVSRDLVHWQELPPAFGADESCDGTQSGGGVVDAHNTSGLTTGDTPVMVAFWTARDNHSQCISFSNDRGRTWTKYAHNPILQHPCRDPNVFWHEPTQRWVMILYGPHEELRDGQKKDYATLFTSPDLLHWEKLHSVPDLYECPDMFELPVAPPAPGLRRAGHDTPDRKWVIVNGDGDYIIGSFDGRTYRPESDKRTGVYGKHFYATMTWGDFPDAPWRRVQIAWMRRWGLELDMPFSQQLSFPCDLSLRQTPEGVRLFRYPIPEIQSLYAGMHHERDRTVTGVETFDALDDKALDMEMDLDLKRSTCRRLRIVVNGHPLVLDLEHDTMNAQEYSAPLATNGDVLHLRVLADTLSIEAFVDKGRLSFSSVVEPIDGVPPLEIDVDSGEAQILNLHVRSVTSMWSACS